ncbi:MAG: PQQ-binding-like beta-propeller repeat protein [Acidimicrobiales bacterium]|nr:PQQ-binding-like beta-propeller repeat protein [Acidimicrobiales bacterium]
MLVGSALLVVCGTTVVAALSSAAGAAVPTSGPVPHTVFDTAWPVYHHDGFGSGFDPTSTDLSPATPAWTSATLDGDIYGEPLVQSGRVIVATENDTIYELAANTGAVLWSTHIGTAVPSGNLPCGDISPTVGITGTPVIDAARGEVFAVTDEAAGSGAQHYFIGLDLYTGAVILHQPINFSPGSDQLAELQRTGLALDDGNVVAGFGGNDGDCGNYHGWVVSVPEGGGIEQSFEVASNAGDSQGAVWMGGAAPEVDGEGNIWFTTGNSAFSSPGDAYDNSDGVIELSPSLGLVQSFAPSTWQSDNGSDLDFSTSPALVAADGLVFAAGKSHIGYLLSQSHLGGVGGQLQTVGSFCSGDVDGGTAVSGTTVYEPCQSGIAAVATSAPSNVNVLWHTNTGAGGPPVVAGGFVWTIGGTTLYGLDPTTGNMVQSFGLGSESNHFPTPSVADGLLLAPSSKQVHAFDGPAGLPPPPPAPPPRPGYWTTASDGGVFSFGGAGFAGSMGGRHLVAPVVGMAATEDGGGYWLVASDGGVFAFGDAAYFGSMGGRPLTKPMVGLAAAPDGDGYWTVASDGGVFSFGGAHYFGSMGGKRLDAPVVGMAATSDGGGYWLVASDGGVFAFGDARFQGSMGGKHLDQPMVAMGGAPGGGYWTVASDGGIFCFGGAGYFGSMGGIRLTRPVVGMTPTSAGQGYWEVASDGGIFAFGDAPFEGSEAGARLAAPMVGIAAPPLP